MALSSGAQSGLQDGQRRDDTAQPEPLRGRGTEPNLTTPLYYQQDRNIAFAGSALSREPVPSAALAKQLDTLASKHNQSPSTAAAALVHIEAKDTPEGRLLTLEAASLGDCDVFVAIKSGRSGETTIQRLFDEFDYPDQFGDDTQPMRKFMAGIGEGTLPDGLQQSVRLPLAPDDTAVVFTASDGLWDGYAGLQKGAARGLDLDATRKELRQVIATSVEQGLKAGETGLADHLVEDLISKSEQSGMKNTDNISVTAMVIKGDGPKPEPIVIGSIDGSGHIGPTEAFVDDMVADIHAKHGPNILPPKQPPLNSLAQSKLATWRENAGRPKPEATPKPSALRL